MKLEKSHEGSGGLHGFLGSMLVHGDEVYATGGTYYKPVLLHSADRGHTFTALNTPETPGLRDLCLVGKTLWVAGEYGMVATTKNHGKKWTKVSVPTGSICLYQMKRDADGALWILGDGGTLLKKTGDAFKQVKHHSSGRMLKIVFDGATPWLLDDPGYLQRWDGKKFVIVPIGKVRDKRVLTGLVRTHLGTLILVGDDGLLLRSTNDGKKWAPPTVKGKPIAQSIEDVLVTKYGIIAVGGEGLFVISNDDGQTWRRVPTKTKIGLWSLAAVGSDVLIGAESRTIFRLPVEELAALFRDAIKKDKVLAGLADHVIAREAGAEMVLEDALRERNLWG